MQITTLYSCPTKASFAGCPLEERKRFSKSHCVVGISVGQLYHEFEKFEATINLINKSFKQCTIVVGDTLQRHNIAARYDVSLEKAYIMAKKAGDAWINRNTMFYQRLTIPYTITRWDYWLRSPHYFLTHEKINKFCDINPFYRRAFDLNIKTYLDRCRERGDKITNEDQLKDNCLNYLKEECAVLIDWASRGCNYFIYPRYIGEAMDITLQTFVNREKSIMLPVSLRFKKRENANRYSSEINFTQRTAV